MFKASSHQPFIEHRADPYVLRYDVDRYYFTASVPEYDRVILRYASEFSELRNAEEVTIWTRHTQGIMSFHIWAPELHNVDGIWYIYFAAGNVDDIWAIRPYVLQCVDSDPLTGCWEELGMVQAADEFSFLDFSLDMTTFVNADKRYSVWAEKVGHGKKISNLYIAEMKTPYRLKSEQVLLSSPDYGWERVGFWVNEGPAVLCRGDRIFLTYSASATGACYCMGMLSASVNDDLLDPRVWEKEKSPVLKTDGLNHMYGPGHNSFFQAGDDTIMAYHARQYKEIVGDPLYDPSRHTFLMKIQWEKGKPVFDYTNNI